MTNPTNSQQFLEIEQYDQLIGCIEGYTIIVLTSLNKNASQTKDIIIRNFIAKSLTCLKSLYQIWKLSDYENSWVLYRSMLERLFLLKYLADKNEFEIFWDWSYIQKYNSRQNARSDQALITKVDPDRISFSLKQKKHYSELIKKGVSWSRPKAEDMARKQMGMSFLYKYGYDHASIHVHPLADDGEKDFIRITGIAPYDHDIRDVINNAIVIQLLLIQSGLNVSSFKWRGIIYDFIDQCMASLNHYDQQHIMTFTKIVKLSPNTEWCVTRESQDTPKP